MCTPRSGVYLFIFVCELADSSAESDTSEDSDINEATSALFMVVRSIYAREAALLLILPLYYYSGGQGN